MKTYERRRRREKNRCANTVMDTAAMFRSFPSQRKTEQPNTGFRVTVLCEKEDRVHLPRRGTRNRADFRRCLIQLIAQRYNRRRISIKFNI